MTNNQHRPCPACKKDQAKHRGNKNGFEIFTCLSCGSLFTDRVPDGSEAENYDEYYGDSNLSVPAFIQGRLEEIIGGFGQFRRNNRILDIGFGAGTMLDVAKDLGWEVHGLEVSLPAVEQARRRGYEVFHGGLKESEYPDDSFDVITASEILEHLPDPEADLREIARILRPGGLFWGTTPSAKGISFRLTGLDWSIISPPEHIQLFSVQAVHRMFKNAGFSNIVVKTHGFNPMEILEHFSSKIRPKNRVEDQTFSRVETGYELNESLTSSPFRRRIKDTINGSLDLLRIGDSLKIFARK